MAPHDLHWRPTHSDPADFFKPIDIIEQESVPFTLWWGGPDDTVPGVSAIRVCVHPEVNADYACISFYMDIGQPWNLPHAATPDPALGQRRHLLMTAVDDIRHICEAQLEPASPRGAASVDLPALPEVLRQPDGRTPDELHEALKSHRNLLYVDVWEAFCGGDGLPARGHCGRARRGVRKLPRPHHVDRWNAARAAAIRPEAAETASVGTVPFANFSADAGFNSDGAEPNAVVKAFWPFVRRVTPRADFREFIACGVFDWRAIYITALGSHSQYVEGQERERARTEEGEASIRVPGHLLGQEEKHLASASGPFDGLVHKRAGSRPGNNHPVRYLLLTKHAPHPRQVGRIAERINTMGTMRLYALKDWAAIRNADAYIRIFGQELDQITKNWGSDRRLIARLSGLEVVRRVKAEIKRLDQALKGAAHRRGEESAGWRPSRRVTGRRKTCCA